MESTSETDKTIFGHIANLMSQDEFLKAHNEFIVANCRTFSEDEENKHEYHEVYNNYVKIIEDAIEGELKTQFDVSDDALNQFYEALKQPGQISAWENENKEVLDTLFSFTDFDKFKAYVEDAT